MFKKLTVFVDRGIERYATQTPKFATFQSALSLPAEVVKLGLCLVTKKPYAGPATNLTKYADGWHAESITLESAISWASRIEAVISAEPNGGLVVKMKFFAKSQKTARVEIGILILPSGEISGTTSSVIYPD